MLDYNMTNLLDLPLDNKEKDINLKYQIIVKNDSDL